MRSVLVCPWGLSSLSLPDGFLVPTVPVERTGRRELAELHADHLFRDVDRDMLVAVVDAESEADEVRQDGGATAPDLDDVGTAGAIYGAGTGIATGGTAMAGTVPIGVVGGALGGLTLGVAGRLGAEWAAARVTCKAEGCSTSFRI